MHLQNCTVILFKKGNWTSNNQIVHWIFLRPSWIPRIIRIYWLKYWIHIDQGQPPPTACLRPIEIFYAKLRMQSKGKATGKTQYKRIETARMTVTSLLLCAVACFEIQKCVGRSWLTYFSWLALQVLSFHDEPSFTSFLQSKMILICSICMQLLHPYIINISAKH